MAINTLLQLCGCRIAVMTSSAIFVGTFFCALFVYAHAQADCSRPPSFKALKECCKTGEPILNIYPECQQYMKGNRPTPCLVDCIFNASSVLQDGKLNPARVRPLLTAMFANSGEAAIDAYATALQTCEPEVQQKLSEMQASGQKFPPMGGKQQTCNFLPVGLAICANKKVFIACPAEIWTSSAECENAKIFLSTCDMENMGARRGPHGGMRGRVAGKRGRRDE